MSRTTEIRHALVAAVTDIAPDARAFSRGMKYDGSREQEFVIRVLIGDPEDEASIERLDEMLDEAGEQSILVALTADRTLDGIVDTLWVVRHRGHQLFPDGSGGTVLGAEWLVCVT